MVTAAQRRSHLSWLTQVTALPTAAGREGRVIDWIERWVARRPNLRLRRDRAGNLLVRQARTPCGEARPFWITAHLDHPAFVLRDAPDGREVELEFRGWVLDPYFENARVEIFDRRHRAHPGRILSLDPKATPFPLVRVRLDTATSQLAEGDVGRWRFRGRGATPVVHRGLLHAPACDDLAGVAAALAALDVLRSTPGCGHVGLLFTRAEEIGFVGALAACRGGSITRRARLLCLETSRSFADSPIGDGPILRVGDKTGVFTGELTNRITQVMRRHEQDDPAFKWQRKMMPGGTCEATTFAAFGWSATCICLPLGNYHNMRDIDGVLAGKRPARVAPEFISVADFHGMVAMLVLVARHLDSKSIPGLTARLEALLDEHESVLDERP